MKTKLLSLLLVAAACNSVEETDPTGPDGSEVALDIEERVAGLEGTSDAHDTRIADLEADIVAIPPSAASHCFWTWDSCGTGPGAECVLACDDRDDSFGDTNDYWAMGGGCDLSAGAQMLENRPGVSDGAFPEEVSEKSFDAWVCQTAAGTVQSVFVQCCR